MTTLTRAMTAEELWVLPHDDLRYYLIEGELRQMPPAGGEHGGIIPNVATFLDLHVRTHHLGKVFAAETGFRVTHAPDTVLAPDFAFVRAENVAATRVGGYIPVVPDLVGEIISPNDLYDEVDEKVDKWLAVGVRLVLVINPRRRIVKVYHPPDAPTTLTTAATLDGMDVVPGWTLPVAEIFA